MQDLTNRGPPPPRAAAWPLRTGDKPPQTLPAPSRDAALRLVSGAQSTARTGNSKPAAKPLERGWAVRGEEDDLSVVVGRRSESRPLWRDEAEGLRQRHELSTRLGTAQEELHGARRGETEARRRQAEAEARAQRAEARALVLEGRLDAAAEREAQLELQLRSLSVVSSEREVLAVTEHRRVVQQMHADMEFAAVAQAEVVEQLEAKVRELTHSLARSEAERVEAETELAHVEERLQLVKKDLDVVSKRTSGLVTSIEEKERTIEAMRDELARAEEDMANAVREARVQASARVFACKHVVNVLLRGGLDDLKCLTAVVEAKLERRPVDVNVLFDPVVPRQGGDNKKHDDDHQDEEFLVVEQVATQTDLAFRRVKQLKERLVDHLARHGGGDVGEFSPMPPPPPPAPAGAPNDDCRVQ